MGKPGKGGKSELDVLTDKVATDMVGAFDLAKGAASGLWTALKGVAKALTWINENVVSLATVGKALASIYVANKLLRLGVELSGAVIALPPRLTAPTARRHVVKARASLVSATLCQILPAYSACSRCLSPTGRWAVSAAVSVLMSAPAIPQRPPQKAQAAIFPQCLRRRRACRRETGLLWPYV